MLASAYERLVGTVRSVALNVIAGATVSPRILRFLLYRAWGVRTQTYNIGAHCFVGGGRLTLGRSTYVNFGCFFDTSAPITIGARCALGPQVAILTSSHDLGPVHQRAGQLSASPVEIGDGCWIGARATILPGVTLGPGAVVAAGACVTADCEPNSLYGGVPARLLRSLTETTA